MKKWTKKGDMPFWLVSTIIVLITLVVLLMIISVSGGRLDEFIDWLERIF